MRPGVAIKDRVLFFTREGAQWFRKGADEYGPFESYGEAKQYLSRMKPSKITTPTDGSG